VTLALEVERTRYCRLLEESVETLVTTLRQMEGVQRVSLFGSYARGRRDLLTDLDILVVMETDRPFVDRLQMLYGRLALPVDADILCYTPEEFGALKSGSWLTQALTDEIVLYERESTTGS